jgi:SRSO17 transposase
VGLESRSHRSESRFASYVEAITTVLGHADRVAPFQFFLDDVDGLEVD